MKTSVILFALVIAVSAVTDKEQWLSFKARYGKTYKNHREENIRFQIFKNHLRRIEKHNARYETREETYKMGITEFSDLTEVEFVNLWKAPKVDVDLPTIKEKSKDMPAEEDFDWRTTSDIRPVQRQGKCQSGYAFSVTAAIESQFYAYVGKKVALSAQELIDCTIGTYNNSRCDGGSLANTYQYVQDNNITLEEDYPYKGVSGHCMNLSYSKIPITFVKIRKIFPDEEAVRQALVYGAPPSISINSAPLQNYKSGILNPVNCSQTELNHAVLLVGYGSENGTGYWRMKNSWGTDFGENGYFRIVRNGENTCGILSQVYWPWINWK